MNIVKLFGSLLMLVGIGFSVNANGQKSIFFDNRVEFDRVVTDSGRAFGQHLTYRTWDLPDSIFYGSSSVGYPTKYLSNKIYTRERIVSVNKKGEVYWCEHPDRPIERNRTHVGQSWLDSTWYEPAKPYPCFKAMLKNDKIYYHRCEKPRFKLLEATLKMSDTMRPYTKSSLTETKRPVNQTLWYRYYVGDTVLRTGGVDVPCFLFEDIAQLESQLRKDLEFVEKRSLLPILTVTKYYDRRYERTINRYRYKLDKTVIVAPSAYIEELIRKSN